MQGACTLGRWVDAGDLRVEISSSLVELLDNQETLAIETEALLGGLVSTLVNGVLEMLSPVLGRLVGNVVLDALTHVDNCLPTS